MVQWEINDELERRTCETFRRIHRLKKQGFQIDWRVTDVEDAFWFKHLGAGPNLIMYPCGKLVAINSSATLDPAKGSDGDRIYNDSVEDARKFDRWINSVPLPNWRQRTAGDRDKYVWTPSFFIFYYAFIFGVAFGLAKIIEAIWASMMS